MSIAPSVAAVRVPRLAFVHRRPRALARVSRFDILTAATTGIGSVVSAWLGLVAGIYSDRAAPFAWALLYAACIGIPLVFRRCFPSTVLVVVSLAVFAAATMRIPDLYAGQFVLFLAFYTVGAWDPHRRRAAVVRVVVIVGMIVWLLVEMFQEIARPGTGLPSADGAFSPFSAYLVLQLLVNIVFFGAAFYLGDRTYADALARRALEERTAELEREREITAAQAVALDRVRLARELHDVVAHHVSAMGVQAGAARTVLSRDPDAARGALEGVEASARSTLSDLRNLLETLRTNDQHEATAGSTLGLDQIADLVEHSRSHGLPTSLTVIGDPVDAPEVVQVNLYRIAQESLTNARRHGGPLAQADVRLRYGSKTIELEVTNSGRPPVSPRSGLGIVGMRERATASGGTIELGPRARGGFLVRVTVPLQTDGRKA